MEKIKENTHRHLFLLLAFLLLLLGLTAWGGWNVYEEHEVRYRHQVEMDLKNTSDLTVRNLSDWRDRLVTAAAAMTDDTLFARAVATWLREADSVAQADLETRMRVLVERGRLTKIILADPQGQVRLVTGNMMAGELPAREMQAFEQALQSAQAVVVEPSADGHFAYPYMGVIAPLYEGMQFLGALWMVVDLRDTLFPLLEAVRGGRATAESVLLMSQGDDVLHINPLRHGIAAQSVGHFAALAQQELVEVQAVRGMRGVVYGQDYQGRAVLAASSVVPDSPWVLVSKMEVAEAFAQDRRKEGLYFGLLIGGSFLTILVFIIYWMWLSQRREQALKQELEIYRHMLEQQVRKDSLTGLGNRRALDELLEQEWKRAVRDALPVAALIMDIDFFKGYNDFYGHLVGDDCLQRVAQVLQLNVQRSKDMIFRYGGEEFVVLLPNTRLSEARQLAEKLCLALRREGIENQASPLGGVVTMSVGVACMQPPHDSADNGHRLLKNADTALYSAKHAGRNRVEVCADETGGEGGT